MRATGNPTAFNPFAANLHESATGVNPTAFNPFAANLHEGATGVNPTAFNPSAANLFDGVTGVNPEHSIRCQPVRRRDWRESDTRFYPNVYFNIFAAGLQVRLLYKQ